MTKKDFTEILCSTLEKKKEELKYFKDMYDFYKAIEPVETAEMVRIKQNIILIQKDIVRLNDRINDLIYTRCLNATEEEIANYKTDKISDIDIEIKNYKNEIKRLSNSISVVETEKKDIAQQYASLTGTVIKEYLIKKAKKINAGIIEKRTKINEIEKTIQELEIKKSNILALSAEQVQSELFAKLTDGKNFNNYLQEVVNSSIDSYGNILTNSNQSLDIVDNITNTTESDIEIDLIDNSNKSDITEEELLILDNKDNVDENITETSLTSEQTNVNNDPDIEYHLVQHNIPISKEFAQTLRKNHVLTNCTVLEDHIIVSDDSLRFLMTQCNLETYGIKVAVENTDSYFDENRISEDFSKWCDCEDSVERNNWFAYYIDNDFLNNNKDIIGEELYESISELESEFDEIYDGHPIRCFFGKHKKQLNSLTKEIQKLVTKAYSIVQSKYEELGIKKDILKDPELIKKEFESRRDSSREELNNWQQLKDNIQELIKSEKTTETESSLKITIPTETKEKETNNGFTLAQDFAEVGVKQDSKTESSLKITMPTETKNKDKETNNGFTLAQDFAEVGVKQDNETESSLKITMPTETKNKDKETNNAFTIAQDFTEIVKEQDSNVDSYGNILNPDFNRASDFEPTLPKAELDLQKMYVKPGFDSEISGGTMESVGIDDDFKALIDRVKKPR